ncbi:MAG TPA: germination protein YpeB [Candidatus Ventricola intestinavium]|nr:germination protein YpeB [Candidatus Ventricola intestinavium]
MKRLNKNAVIIALAVLLCVSLGANAVLAVRERRMATHMIMQHQREMTDVVAAMADIEINLSKLLIASGAAQSVSLLGETALLAQHVESGLARLPLNVQTAAEAMKFAGQMGQYTMALVTQVSSGGMISSEDERQLEDMMTACRQLNEHLVQVEERMYAQPLTEGAAPAQENVQSWPAQEGDSAIEYPSLIYDGPFSDGRQQGEAKGLTGERVTREQAREAAARYAGVTADRVRDGADSGGQFEAFGFVADTPDGMLSVQVTGQGAHLLWMVPEQAEFAMRRTVEECLENARVYLADQGFGQMEVCFVQEYDGMVVANFASVQDGVLLYPDQVKVQVSMDSGRVVGAECTQYLMNHIRREGLEPELTVEEARELISQRLNVRTQRLCVIPEETGERLCWGFEGTFAGADYWVFIDAMTGETAQILRVVDTQDGETAV